MKVETISHKYSAATFNIHWVAVPGRRGAGASSVGTYSEHREDSEVVKSCRLACLTCLHSA